MKTLVIMLICLFVGTLSGASQPEAGDQLKLAFDLQRQGKYEQVVEVLPPVIQANTLPENLKAQTLTVLGFAYEALGEFNKAQSCYEQAILILAKDGKDSEDYALALMNFANLFGEEGRNEDASNLDKRAVETFKISGNGLGLARAYLALASRELRQNHLRKCRQYLRVAENTADDYQGVLDDDYRAQLASLRGHLAENEGNARDAISEYRIALALWRRRHGDHHMMSGWARVQLGEAESLGGEDMTAVSTLSQGLDILEESVGKHNPKYLRAEIVYASVLNKLGCKDQATRVRSAATEELATIFGHECIRCRFSAAAFQ